MVAEARGLAHQVRPLALHAIVGLGGIGEHVQAVGAHVEVVGLVDALRVVAGLERLQSLDTALQHVAGHSVARVASRRQTLYRVSGLEPVGGAALPPGPAAVGLLQVAQAAYAAGHYVG